MLDFGAVGTRLAAQLLFPEISEMRRIMLGALLPLTLSYLDFALKQFGVRLEILEQVKGKATHEIYQSIINSELLID